MGSVRTANKAARAVQIRWLIAILLSCAQGIVPLGRSGVLELVVVGLLPPIVVLFVANLRESFVERLILAIALSAGGSLVRLVASSLVEETNWLAVLGWGSINRGLMDPQFRHLCLLLVFPIGASVAALLGIQAVRDK